MFYTFDQEQYQNNREIERFVIVEADSDEEALSRATYFGIDFDETLPNSLDKRWWEDRGGGWRRGEPLIAGNRPIRYTNNGGWVILYKNDNITSSRAIPLDDEYDHIADSIDNGDDDDYENYSNTDTFAMAT